MSDNIDFSIVASKTGKSWLDDGTDSFLAVEITTQRIITYILRSEDAPKEFKEKVKQALDFAKKNRILDLLNKHNITYYLFRDYNNFKKIREYNKMCGEVISDFIEYSNKKQSSEDCKQLIREYQKALIGFMIGCNTP